MRKSGKFRDASDEKLLDQNHERVMVVIFTGFGIGMILTVRFYTTLELEQIEILQIEFVEYSSCSRMVNIHYCVSICCKKICIYIYIYLFATYRVPQKIPQDFWPTQITF